jgi:hypothetical protein
MFLFHVGCACGMSIVGLGRCEGTFKSGHHRMQMQCSTRALTAPQSATWLCVHRVSCTHVEYLQALTHSFLWIFWTGSFPSFLLLISIISACASTAHTPRLYLVMPPSNRSLPFARSTAKARHAEGRNSGRRDPLLSGCDFGMFADKKTCKSMQP